MSISSQAGSYRTIAFEVAAALVALALLFLVVSGRSERVVMSYELLPQIVFEEVDLSLTLLTDLGIVSGGLPPEDDGAWLGAGLVRIAFEGRRLASGVLVLDLYAPDWQESAPVVVATNANRVTVGSVSVIPGQATTLGIATDAIRGDDRDDVATFEVTLSCSSDEPNDDDAAPALCLKLFGVRVEETDGAP